jgi:type II secretory pathway pseudopilin PulG
MGLRGQGGERGYAMAALLVTLAVMGILMSVAMPVWRQEARREKEAELIFRGEQIARAIALFRTKNNNAMPASLDVLVTGRFLRKKFREPMAKDGEWRLITAASGNPNPGQPGQPPQAGPSGQPQRGFPPPSQQQPPGGQFPQSGGQSQVAGGIMGVSSKSTETSLRLYQGANRYDQWQFRFTDVARGRGGVPGANDPAGRGNNPEGRQPGRGNSNQPGRGGRGIGSGDGGTGFRVPPFGSPGGNRGGAPGSDRGSAPPPSGPGRGVGRGQ